MSREKTFIFLKILLDFGRCIEYYLNMNNGQSNPNDNSKPSGSILSALVGKEQLTGLLFMKRGLKMRTKSEQLEVCRTCPGQDCQTCHDNEFVKTIQKNLQGVSNISYSIEGGEWFGKAPCQLCEESLAGDRQKITAKDDKTGGQVNFDVCIDCYEYLLM